MKKLFCSGLLCCVLARALQAASVFQIGVPIYLLAALTGIRRGEIKQLRWTDVDLDSATPKITVPAAISKNHYEDALPLHPDLAVALRKIKPESRKPEQLIFKGMFPGYKQFYIDLKAAGINWEDHGEGRLDFHSFRVTYCTQLAPGTPSERVRMALMRTRDPKQTAKTYTDARMLPLKEAIEKLDFHRPPVASKNDTQIDTQNSVAAGQNGSTAVTWPVQVQHEKPPVFMLSKSLFVTPWHEESKEGKWSERQDLNLRRLAPKASALAKLSYAPICAHDWRKSAASQRLFLLISPALSAFERLFSPSSHCLRHLTRKTRTA
jgi:Phage integrase family